MLKDIDTQELSLSAVMHYTSWLVQQSPKDGAEVFIRSPRSKDMDPNEVLERLEGFSNQVIQMYLEYLVTSLKSENPEYYTRLACSYTNDIYDEIKAKNGLELFKELGKKKCVLLFWIVAITFFSTVDDFKRQVSPYPIEEDIDLSHSTFIGYLNAEKSQIRLVQLRLSLIKFLQRSSLYLPEIVMEALTKAGPLDIEKCIVYGRMGKHGESLDILIHGLSDFVGAETYCITNGSSAGIIPTTTIPARTSSLSEKPLPLTEYISEKDLEERRVLFTKLFNLYLSIDNR